MSLDGSAPALGPDAVLPEIAAPAARPPRTLKANFAINVAGAVVPLAVSLVTVPIYIRHIGDARYGVLSIVWVLLGYLGFLDFGLSRAAVRSLARLKDAPQEERARVLVTTLALNAGLGLLGSVVLATLGSYLLQHVLNVPDALKPEIARALPWIVVLFPLALVGGVAIGTLESRERFAMANVLGVGGTAAGQIIPVILAVAVGPSLAVVIPTAVVVRIVSVVLGLWAVWRQEGPLSPRHVDRTKARELLSYGSWLTVSGVIGPVLVSLDQFALGSLLGVSAVTYYAVPMSLVTRSQVFPSALVRTIFPRLSGVSSDEAQRLATRAFMMIAFAYATVCAPAVVLAPTFLQIWISPGFATASGPVAAVLFAGAWTNALAFVPLEVLQAQGKPDVSGKLHAAELIPFIIVLLGLTAAFGLLGAAIAWCLRVMIDGLCQFAAARMPTAVLRQTILPLVLLIGAGFLAKAVGTDPWKSIPVAGSVGILLAGLSFTKLGDLRPFAEQLVKRVTPPAIARRRAAAKADHRIQGLAPKATP